MNLNLILAPPIRFQILKLSYWLILSEVYLFPVEDVVYNNVKLYVNQNIWSSIYEN